MTLPFDASAAAALWHTDPDQCVKKFRDGFPDFDAYAQGLTHIEWHHRIKNNQMPYHCSDMNELYFDYTYSDLTEFRDLLTTKHKEFLSNAGYAMLLGFTTDAIGGSSQYFYDYAAQRHPGIAEMVHYDWEERCPDPNELVACVEAREIEGDPDNVVLVSMDQPYAQRFLKGIVSSFQAHSDQGLIIHLMDCDYAFISEVKEKLGFGIICEWPHASRNYYHTARFLRMAHLQRHLNKKMWISDADVLFTGDMEEIWALPGELVWRARPGRMEPWNQLNACLFGCSNQGFLDQVAGYIGRLAYEDKMHWGADQMAMHATWKRLAPTGLSISLLDDRQLCYDDRENALVTAFSGSRKKLLAA